jgi:hypothetical protein
MKKILYLFIVAALICSCGNSGGKKADKKEKAVKIRGYIYYKSDAGKAVKQEADMLKGNYILRMEGIAVVEGQKGQKDNWQFIDNKVMIIPDGGNDDVFEQALDFFGVDYDKYGLIR